MYISIHIYVYLYISSVYLYIDLYNIVYTLYKSTFLPNIVFKVAIAANYWLKKWLVNSSMVLYLHQHFCLTTNSSYSVAKRINSQIPLG